MLPITDLAGSISQQPRLFWKTLVLRGDRHAFDLIDGIEISSVLFGLMVEHYKRKADNMHKLFTPTMSRSATLALEI